MHFSNEQIQQYLDGSLNDSDLFEQIKNHLSQCQSCASSANQYQHLFDALAFESAPNTLSNSFFTRVQARIEKQQIRKQLFENIFRGTIYFASVILGLFVVYVYYDSSQLTLLLTDLFEINLGEYVTPFKSIYQDFPFKIETMLPAVAVFAIAFVVDYLITRRHPTANSGH